MKASQSAFCSPNRQELLQSTLIIVSTCHRQQRNSEEHYSRILKLGGWAWIRGTGSGRRIVFENVCPRRNETIVVDAGCVFVWARVESCGLRGCVLQHTRPLDVVLRFAWSALCVLFVTSGIACRLSQVACHVARLRSC